jgi:SAM-dependent methyltransferase
MAKPRFVKDEFAGRAYATISFGMDVDEKVTITLQRTLRAWWKHNAAERGVSPTLRAFFGELWGFLRDSTPEQRRRRYGDVEYDWEHRVDTTSATVDWRDRLLGIFHSPYQPTEPALFHEMLAVLRTDFAEFTFIDLGSGKGRTLLMASEYPFRRIVGVELLPELQHIAQENLNKFQSKRQKCFHLESLCGDACEFAFPPEPTVLYLFNPLPKTGLSRVISNLESSLRANPRKLFVLYHNPLHEEVLSAGASLRKTGGTHQYSVYESR